MMVPKVLFLLAVLGLVNLPAASATVQQQQQGSDVHGICHTWRESVQSCNCLHTQGNSVSAKWSLTG